MPQKVKIKSILKDARRVRAVWEENREFTMGEIDLPGFISKLTAADELDRQLAEKRVELTGMLAERDDRCKELNELVTRFRSGMRGAYGSDSAQYAQTGATPRSARKPPKRKKAASGR